MLAIQSKGQLSFVPAPPQQLLLSLAELRNKAPLPELRLRHGLRIPPEGECLLNPNFQLQRTDREPLLPATAMDVDAIAAKQASAHNIEKKHIVSIETPAEGWQPGPDAPAEPWP
jgi:Transcription initiation factor IID, 31kD subunit